MRTVLLSGFLFLAGCGDSGPDNISSCQKFVDAAKCGSVDLSETFNCSTYNVGTCDLSPYFTCLSTHYVCVNGSYDSAKMMGIQECMSLANCN